MPSTLEIPRGQNWIIHMMKDMNFPLQDENGICFGISHMGMQAVLAKDCKTFNKRLHSIYNLYVEKFVRYSHQHNLTNNLC